MSQKLALPYASLLLERRQGQIALIPAAAVPAGPAPTDAEVQEVAALYKNAAATYAAAPDQAAALIANPDNPPPSGIPPAELAAWTAVANVLLNLDETLMKR